MRFALAAHCLAATLWAATDAATLWLPPYRNDLVSENPTPEAAKLPKSAEKPIQMPPAASPIVPTPLNGFRRPPASLGGIQDITQGAHSLSLGLQDPVLRSRSQPIQFGSHPTARSAQINGKSNSADSTAQFDNLGSNSVQSAKFPSMSGPAQFPKPSNSFPRFQSLKPTNSRLPIGPHNDEGFTDVIYDAEGDAVKVTVTSVTTTTDAYGNIAASKTTNQKSANSAPSLSPAMDPSPSAGLNPQNPINSNITDLGAAESEPKSDVGRYTSGLTPQFRSLLAAPSSAETSAPKPRKPKTKQKKTGKPKDPKSNDKDDPYAAATPTPPHIERILRYYGKVAEKLLPRLRHFHKLPNGEDGNNGGNDGMAMPQPEPIPTESGATPPDPQPIVPDLAPNHVAANAAAIAAYAAAAAAAAAAGSGGPSGYGSSIGGSGPQGYGSAPLNYLNAAAYGPPPQPSAYATALQNRIMNYVPTGMPTVPTVPAYGNQPSGYAGAQGTGYAMAGNGGYGPRGGGGGGCCGGMCGDGCSNGGGGFDGQMSNGCGMGGDFGGNGCGNGGGMDGTGAAVGDTDEEEGYAPDYYGGYGRSMRRGNEAEGIPHSQLINGYPGSPDGMGSSYYQVSSPSAGSHLTDAHPFAPAGSAFATSHLHHYVHPHQTENGNENGDDRVFIDPMDSIFSPQFDHVANGTAEERLKPVMERFEMSRPDLGTQMDSGMSGSAAIEEKPSGEVKLGDLKAILQKRFQKQGNMGESGALLDGIAQRLGIFDGTPLKIVDYAGKTPKMMDFAAKTSEFPLKSPAEVGEALEKQKQLNAEPEASKSGSGPIPMSQRVLNTVIVQPPQPLGDFPIKFRRFNEFVTKPTDFGQMAAKFREIGEISNPTAKDIDFQSKFERFGDLSANLGKELEFPSKEANSSPKSGFSSESQRSSDSNGSAAKSNEIATSPPHILMVPRPSTARSFQITTPLPFIRTTSPKFA